MRHIARNAEPNRYFRPWSGGGIIENMNEGTTNKGNNPELWQKLQTVLDDKLQLGLLNYLQRVESYHFEDDTLFVEPGSVEDYEYLTRDAVFQQLQVLAQDAVKVEKVKIKKPA